MIQHLVEKVIAISTKKIHIKSYMKITNIKTRGCTMIMKKFKKVLFGGVALSVLTLAAGLPVSAEVNDTGGVDNKGATSRGHVTLKSNGETEEPTGPIVDPGEGDDGEKEDGGSTGNTGALRVDWVTPLEFGTQKLSSESATYRTTSINPNVQVSDLRGTGDGWTLFVTASEFTDGKNTLKGATITLPEGTPKTTNGNISEAPTTYGVELVTDGTSDPVRVMKAFEDTGMGTWADEFEDNEEDKYVTLSVPAGNYAGDYEATLTWTLSDAPQ